MWKEAEEFLVNDSYIHSLIKKWGSCAIKKSREDEYFDDLAQSIIGQQLSGKAADSIYNKLRKNLKIDNSLLSPEKILKVDFELLRSSGLSNAKASYLLNLSEKIAGGELNLSQLDNRGDEEIVAELTKIKGIGRWTAEMFLMFSLARPDIFPVDDLGIRKAMDKLFNKKLDKTEMFKLSLRWKPYRTVASWYLWKSLE